MNPTRTDVVKLLRVGRFSDADMTVKKAVQVAARKGPVKIQLQDGRVVDYIWDQQQEGWQQIL